MSKKSASDHAALWLGRSLLVLAATVAFLNNIEAKAWGFALASLLIMSAGLYWSLSRPARAKVKGTVGKGARWVWNTATRRKPPRGLPNIDEMSGVEFESFLAQLFRRKGFRVQTTPVTADKGADLLLERDGRRIAVQAKRYTGTVGTDAVQQVIAGMLFYDCNEALVIATSSFTPEAQRLARKTKVQLWDRERLSEEIRW